MLSVNVEQRVDVKLCVKLGKCATETNDLLKKVCGDECQVLEWFKSFKMWREEIGDDQRLCRPSKTETDANIEKVREIVKKFVAWAFGHLMS